MTDLPHAIFEKSLGKEIVQTSKVHLNLGQEVIVTTEDKVRLCMTNHATRLAKRTAWIGPVSLFVTILLVLLTANFRDAFGIPQTTWHALFLLGAASTAIWSLVAVYAALKTPASIDQIVAELKKESAGASDPNGSSSLSQQSRAVATVAVPASNGKP